MTIIDRYIIKKNLLYLLFTTIVIFTFISIVNLFERINMLSKKNIDIPSILKYTLFTSPFYLYLLMPLVTLISFILLLNYLITSHEYKAIYSSAYPSYIFLKNMLIVASFVVLFLFLLFDRYSTFLYSKVKRNTTYGETINFKIGQTLMHAKLVDKYTLKQVYINDSLNNKQLYIQKLIWDEGSKKWIAHNLYKIKDNNEKNTLYTLQDLSIFNIPPPEVFIVEDISDYNSYSISELILRIKKLKRLSLNTNQEESVVFFRVGIILINIVSAFLAFVIFKTPLINNKGFAITSAVIASILIWFLITIFKRASDIETIPPYTISFIPHLITVLVTAYLNRRFDKVF